MYRCELAGKHFYIFTFIFSPSIEIKIRSFREISLSIVNSVSSRQDKKDINDDTHFSE
mgnify:CR=1 FL=1